MVIHGVSGCGKTTVLAHLLLSCQMVLQNLAIVFRFINVSAESSSLELLLHSMLQQIHYVINGRQLWQTHVSSVFYTLPILGKCDMYLKSSSCTLLQNISKYVELFPKFLSLASENRPVLIVIDGLDQVRSLTLLVCS